MSRDTLDFSKMTIDDLFRAKEKRRRRLARLPFEQKIEIVKRLQSVARVIKPIREARRKMLSESEETPDRTTGSLN